MQEAPIHQSHVFGRIKILRTNFEMGHPRNISVKFKIRPTVPEEKVFKELLKKFVAIATRVFDGIKFREQLLKKTS